MINIVNKNEARLARHSRVRKNLSGTPEMPRLNVYRSTTNIYAQIIDDVNGVTLVSASSLDKDLAKSLEGKTKKEQAGIVGGAVAKKATEKGLSKVVFDRGGYLYTGRIKELAESARNAGLVF